MAEPPITKRAAYSSFTAGDNLPVTRIVLHATCPLLGFPKASAAGQAAATAAYFAARNPDGSPKAGGSAHYVVDVAGEQHCVPDGTVAYHAPPNAHSIGIEIASDGGDPTADPKTYTRAQWLDPAVWPAVQLAAARTAELCTRFSVPAIRLGVADLLAGHAGICGHVDVSQAWHQSSHSDPGPEFPWPEFMAAVNAILNPPAPSPARRTLTYGMRNDPDVKKVQARMAIMFKSYAADLPATGNYLDQTAAAILEFQHRTGVKNADGSAPDGRTIGANTWAQLIKYGF